MIQTKYKINLQIDDESFDLVITEPNAKQRELLEQSANKDLVNLDALSQISDEISLNESIIKTNQALIKQGSKDISLLLENKELLKANLKLKIELSKSAGVVSNLEKLYRLRSELLISGDDKEKLFQTLDAKGVKFEILWEHINKEIIKAQEKN